MQEKLIAMGTNVFRYLQKRSIGEVTPGETHQIETHFANKKMREMNKSVAEVYIELRDLRQSGKSYRAQEFLAKKDLHLYKYPVLRKMAEEDFSIPIEIQKALEFHIGMAEDVEIDRVCGDCVFPWS